MRTRHGRAPLLALTAALAGLLAGCSAGPAALDSMQIEEIMEQIELESPDRSTVAEALRLSPMGTIGVLDAREATLDANPPAAPIPSPGAEQADWVVVSTCGSAGAVPSILLVALPAEEADAYLAAPWGTSCDLTQ
ncbi:hypothetical protein [Agrococcus sp. ARC_14]|uniref:hypothetical protein n=1 Tax=Agrococcus sp. ARC_14 TaxID=2919927 RepID=UPI001F06455C|nr:hypothetical protein [Agrococcus sp. ARC_14]MCH1883013.1 hypothetical protein [Agrococcus sp. ARC_14]